jgi:hypothetical protein
MYRTFPGTPPPAKLTQFFNQQLYELLLGERLFDPSFQTEELGLSTEESHLIQILELFGGFPLDLLRAGEYSPRWFTDSGAFSFRSLCKVSPLRSALQANSN